MKKQIWIPILIIAIVIVGLVIFLPKSKKQVDKEPIKIGAILPLSGKDIEWGEKPQKGIELALEEVNKNKKLIEVVYEDSESSPEKAVSAAHKLININKVQILMCQLSDICSVLAPFAQENNILLFGFSNAPDLTNAGDYIFNLRGDSIYAGEALGRFAGDKYKTVAILYLNNPTVKGLYEGFKEAFENKGGEVLLAESHNKDDSDFRTSLTKIKEKNPEVLLLASRYKNEIDLIKQAKELGLNQPVICNLGTDTKSFIDGLKDLAEGIIYPTATVSYDTQNSKLQTALDKYQEKYDEPMPIWAAESYDSIKLVASFIEENKNISQSSEIKKMLVEANGFPGLAGEITFDETRTVVKDYYLFTIKNGQFVPYEE